MQIRNAQSAEKRTEGDESDNLLDCRIAILGLDFEAIKQSDTEAVVKIIRECARCGSRADCVVDLKRDPNNPVWETYCPNAETLIALAKERWEQGSR